MKIKAPYYKQDKNNTCGPAAVQMILKFCGIFRSEQSLADELVGTDGLGGTCFRNIQELIKSSGLFYYAENNASLRNLQTFLGRNIPVLVNYIEPSHDEGHYAVVVGMDAENVIINDPLLGEGYRIARADFKKRWRGEDGQTKKWFLAASTEELLT